MFWSNVYCCNIKKTRCNYCNINFEAEMVRNDFGIVNAESDRVVKENFNRNWLTG